MNREVFCVLCHRSDETDTTGGLLTEDQVTAHAKCMLYSAGIFCQDSPQFGDLAGFRAEDVKEEVKRGRKLVCHRCEKRGATLGCEVRRCSKSYHFPCAVEDGAKPVDDETGGKYVIYCSKHAPEPDSGSIDSVASGSACGGRPAKKTRRRPDRRLGGRPAKRKTQDCFPPPPDDSFCTEDINMYAPVESDLEDNENSEQQIHRDAAEEPGVSPSGGRQDDESPRENSDEDDTIIDSPEVGSQDNDDSQSLRSPASSQHALLQSEQEPAGGATEDSSPVQRSAQDQATTSPPGSSHEPVPPLSFPMCPPPSPPPPPAPEPSIDPSGFWKSCNVAGCTQAIFQDFFDEMNKVADRIYSDQASEEDYDLALSVMAASGKLAVYTTKQQEELQRKQEELQKASAAMTEVNTALRRRLSAGARASASLGLFI